jgi:hypothetical protein
MMKTQISFAICLASNNYSDDILPIRLIVCLLLIILPRGLPTIDLPSPCMDKLRFTRLRYSIPAFHPHNICAADHSY